MSLFEFKCPNCGASLSFDTDVQEMTCPYCETVISADYFHSRDEELHEEQRSEHNEWSSAGTEWRDGEQDGMRVYSCRSCGGEIIGDETLGATSCPFCGSAVVMSSQFSGTLRPEIVVPFKKSRETAFAALKKYYQKKFFLPKVFKDESHLEEIKGVYVPFWLFDTHAEGEFVFEGTTVRSWSDRRYHYTETSFYDIFRSGSLGFHDVPADGSKAIDDILMQSIEPFDLVQAQEFGTAYLAGFFANKYDVAEDAARPVAETRIRTSTSAEFRGTVSGYSSVREKRGNVSLLRGNVKYALLPVWFLGTTWRGKKYTFAMNGQTGKFVGNLPADNGKRVGFFFGLFFGITAVLSGLLYLAASFLK
ncbi:MAG: hypothetical protein LBO63_06650 [Oscillospiraceae bacterium]|jgi:DNA-directed RNA polymerase subunit RPC12/RpoP|nr:hypothetical protein [Oscillospiraceae bacterium]